MIVRVWGVRGSIPTPGKDTVKIGGNTLCLEMRIPESKKIFIIDAGSGIRPLGQSILKNDLPKGPLEIDLLFTHTHWDHIMGFPFFVPAYIPSSKIRFFGPGTYEDDNLENIVCGQLQYRYFPINHSQLSAEITYQHLKEQSMELVPGLQVSTKYLNHPVLCLGYRFSWRDKVLCTAFDTEPFRNLFPEDPQDPSYDEESAKEGRIAANEENRRIVEFLRGADYVFFDTQYTQAEYEKSKLGWGHSTYDHAIKIAEKASVKNLIFIHHDPTSDDQKLISILKEKRKGLTSSLKIYMAWEGMEIRL